MSIPALQAKQERKLATSEAVTWDLHNIAEFHKIFYEEYIKGIFGTPICSAKV